MLGRACLTLVTDTCHKMRSRGEHDVGGCVETVPAGRTGREMLAARLGFEVLWEK